MPATSNTLVQEQPVTPVFGNDYYEQMKLRAIQRAHERFEKLKGGRSLPSTSDDLTENSIEEASEDSTEESTDGATPRRRRRRPPSVRASLPCWPGRQRGPPSRPWTGSPASIVSALPMFSGTFRAHAEAERLAARGGAAATAQAATAGRLLWLGPTLLLRTRAASYMHGWHRRADHGKPPPPSSCGPRLPPHQ